jgi:hypothetical protein
MSEDKKSVQGWREIYEIKERIPNEAIYVAADKLFDEQFYPLANIYPYHVKNRKLFSLPFCFSDALITEESFKNKLHESQIEYAISFLQPNALKKYMQDGCYFDSERNPFLFLLNCQLPYIGPNKEAYKKIAEILIEKYSNYVDLISRLNNIYSYCLNRKYVNEIMGMLNSLLPHDDENQCLCCFQTQPAIYLLNGICDCKKSLIHADCLVKLLEHTKDDKCHTCTKKYKLNKKCYKSMRLGTEYKIDERIFFPYHDLYYTPQMSSSKLNKYTDIQRLTRAIEYLQVDRVKQLLEEREILEKLSDYLYGYEGYKQTPIIALCGGNIGDNYMYCLSDNSEKYHNILMLLIGTKKINLHHKDAFDKTAIDYMYERIPLDNKNMKIFQALLPSDE